MRSTNLNFCLTRNSSYFHTCREHHAFRTRLQAHIVITYQYSDGLVRIYFLWLYTSIHFISNLQRSQTQTTPYKTEPKKLPTTRLSKVRNTVMQSHPRVTRMRRLPIRRTSMETLTRHGCLKNLSQYRCKHCPCYLALPERSTLISNKMNDRITCIPRMIPQITRDFHQNINHYSIISRSLLSGHNSVTKTLEILFYNVQGLLIICNTFRMSF